MFMHVKNSGVVMKTMGLLLVILSGISAMSCSEKSGGQTAPPSSTPAVNRSVPADTVEPVEKTEATKSGLVPNYHALVIGISKYDGNKGQGWQPLNNARRDAEAVGDLLEKEYGFNVIRLFDENATRDGMMVQLDRLSKLGKDDALLVYYAGHGYYEESLDEGYWIPSDARLKKDNRLTKEDWIWNSTITKMISATPARHVLVIADACYSGSLFRGGELEAMGRKAQWYKRALAAPSRFLITSGDLEPVLDSGAQHSIFAQQVLNYLAHPEKDVFSASDLGKSIRDRVSTLTGQLVRMGPMKVPTDAGGEFVFLKPSADVQSLETASEPDPMVGSEATERGSQPEVPVAAVDSRQVLQDSVLLASQGATNSAQKLLESVAADSSVAQLAAIVKNHLSAEQQRDKQESLQKLIDRLSERKKAVEDRDNPWSDYAKPRIVACIGPVSHGKTDDDEARVLMYRLLLSQGLSANSSIISVEREALESVLAEMDIGTSDLADPRAQIEAGKLLPASMLILGDIVPTEQGDRLSLRLVDTATSRLLGTFSEINPAAGDMHEVCQKISAAIVDTAIKKKPLTAKVLEQKDDQLIAGVGSFQGVAEGATFEIVSKSAAAGAAYQPEKILGSAEVVSSDEMWSVLQPEWTGDPAGQPADSILLVREKIN